MKKARLRNGMASGPTNVLVMGQRPKSVEAIQLKKFLVDGKENTLTLRWPTP
jgi:hypothetical protein